MSALADLQKILGYCDVVYEEEVKSVRLWLEKLPKQDIMTPGEFKKKMDYIGDFDPEGCHVKADILMCDLLRSLGYKDGIEIFENHMRWYA